MRYDDQDEDRAPIGRRQKPARNNRAPARRSPAHNRKNEQDDDEWYDDPDRDLPDDEQDEEAYDDDYDDDHDELADDDDAEEQLMARRPSWKRRLLSLGLKLALVGIAVMALWGIYLDGKIRDRMDGQVWQLPASVYSRIINLQPGEPYSLKMMSEALEGMQYRPVNALRRPGDMVVGKSSIDIFRRPFDFPDGPEPQMRLRLSFANNQLVSMRDLDSNEQMQMLRIDPKLIAMLQSPHNEQRLFTPREGFPDLLIETLLLTEDRDFYQHDGINPLAIGRAIWVNLLAGRTVQGGSTITQQLAKNLFLTNQRSLIRKAREAYMAVLIDYRYSKERILETYLNEVYLGQNGNDQIHGFALASLFYFGRPVNELTTDQQALLVGMVKGPSYYNPWRYPERAIERRNVVLKVMQEQQVIDQELYDLLSKRPLGIQARGVVTASQPAYMQVMRQELRQALGDKSEKLSGMRIFTTLDPAVQNAAEKAVQDGIPALLSQRHLKQLETAMVVTDRYSGEIRAMIGGAQTRYAGFNRALQARRPIGSLIKPPVYMTALTMPDRFRLNTPLSDNPLSMRMPNGQLWQPKNYDRKYRGSVTLLTALSNSLNVPTVNLGMQVGLDTIATELTKMGIDNQYIPRLPAMLLGAISLTPMEVTQMYQTLASGGQYVPMSTLRTVLDENGQPLYESLPQAQSVVPTQAADLALYGMQQVVASGTARSLNKSFNAGLAGKTGTTNELRDSWYVGVDGKNVVTVWVGRDDNGEAKLTGANGALTLYRRYLEELPPMPLVLKMPPGIAWIGVTPSGQFDCGAPQKLPVWTSDPDQFCAPPNPVDQMGSWLQNVLGL
ncbi:bifunctional glycosyl transferase/transpeptidase [Plesiomonas shigelloides]|uniref:bifunctional glycosyl transferase/transpeptidase n=1 Tax=Plesiomonas shigelloides TaxID=703 RepID=UPI0022472731|nr:bifunctional glycosyl transferase/transpeptidase [Plesiomonas shigelloides]MCX2533488.1 bifunctional glycosyl transferase/transpeptidase [Plesiomonas shigelloides]